MVVGGYRRLQVVLQGYTAFYLVGFRKGLRKSKSRY